MLRPDLPHVTPETARTTFWTPRTGPPVALGTMTSAHLRNTARHLVRHIRAATARIEADRAASPDALFDASFHPDDDRVDALRHTLACIRVTLRERQATPRPAA